MTRGELRSVAFRSEREAGWRELESLLDKVERRGFEGLREKELVRLPVLHRAAMSALSVARSVSLDRNLLEYLESLTQRSYMRLYGSRRGFGLTVRNFFSQRFPRAVREARWAVLLAFSVMMLGGVIGFVITTQDLERYYSFISAEMAGGRDPTATREELLETLFDGGDRLTVFASFLFTHNSQVAILCFVLGFAAGVPVLYLLMMNGMLLGAMSGLFHVRGLSVEWWSWILPHGVPELGAIVLCGAAGFLQGYAVVFPGRRSRLANLKRAGHTAGQIVIGCVAMLFIAALIEGYFRQLVQSVPIRYGLAGCGLVVWVTYFCFAGRRGEAQA